MTWVVREDELDEESFGSTKLIANLSGGKQLFFRVLDLKQVVMDIEDFCWLSLL
jgi:hypothetical protein